MREGSGAGGRAVWLANRAVLPEPEGGTTRRRQRLIGRCGGTGGGTAGGRSGWLRRPVAGAREGGRGEGWGGPEAPLSPPPSRPGPRSQASPAQPRPPAARRGRTMSATDERAKEILRGFKLYPPNGGREAGGPRPGRGGRGEPGFVAPLWRGRVQGPRGGKGVVMETPRRLGCSQWRRGGVSLSLDAAEAPRGWDRPWAAWAGRGGRGRSPHSAVRRGAGGGGPHRGGGLPGVPPHRSCPPGGCWRAAGGEGLGRKAAAGAPRLGSEDSLRRAGEVARRPTPSVPGGSAPFRSGPRLGTFAWKGNTWSSGPETTKYLVPFHTVRY